MPTMNCIVLRRIAWPRPSPFRWPLATLLAVAGMIGFPGSANAGEEYRHPVQPGETLIGISRDLLQNPGDWTRLQTLNKISDPYRIRPGTVLRIPFTLLRRDPGSAKVTAISGVVRAGGEPLKPGSAIGPGAQVVTGAQSFATIELIDGSRLVLQPGSQMKFEELSRYHNTNLPNTRLRLDGGRIESIVTKTLAPSPQYTIVTPSAIIGVRGTRFRVAADEMSHASRAEVTDGTVGVQGGSRDKASAVAAGYGVVAEAGGTVSAPAALLPKPDLGALPKLQERTIVRFSFPALSGAQSYRVQVGADADMHNVLAEAAGAKPEAKFADLPDGNYTLRVRGIDAKGLEGRDADFSFQLKARPEPPFAAAPLTGTKLRAESAELVWTNNLDAARYRIQLAGDDKFSTPVADIDGIEGTVIVPARKLPPGDYYWRARSLRADGDVGPWGDAQHFVLKPLPADPEPPKIDNDHLSFAWSGEPGQTFLFQLASDPKFAETIIEQQLDQPSTMLARPDAGTYYMRVRATDADGFVGPFTNPQKIEVPMPPPPWWLPLLIFLPALL